MRSRLNPSSTWPCPRRVRYDGFTLIELLVAISILSIIAVLGWRGLDSIVRARIALTSNLEQTRGMQLAFAQLQSDCAHLVSSKTIPGMAPLVAEDGRLTLVRTVFGDNQPSKAQIVTYRVKDGVLTRRESAATRDLSELGALWQSAANGTESLQTVTLLSDVTELTMRLWVSKGASWQTAAQVAQQTYTPLPAGHPQTGQPGTAPPLTGLEVAMQLQGREGRLLKVFLLGAV